MDTNRNRFTSLYETGTAGQQAPGGSGRERLDDLAGQWLRNSRLRVKETSYVKYRNLVNNHIVPELGERYTDMLTTEAVSGFISARLANGRRDGTGGLSEKSARDILTALKGICSYGTQQGLYIPCRFELVKFRREENDVRILDRNQCAALERFLLADDSLVKTGVLISLFMGVRLGEVCALKKENILYKEEVLQIRATMQRIQTREEPPARRTKIITTLPKSVSSVRDIPIPAFLIRRLRVLAAGPDGAYLLTGRPEKFIEPRTLENIFQRYLRACGMPRINYHALRHTFATRCIEVGFDIKTLSEILGHSSVNITLNRYVHSSMEQKRNNMGKLRLLG